MVTMFCILNNFVFADSEMSWSYISNAGINESSSTIVSSTSSSNRVYYCYLEKGQTYTFVSNATRVGGLFDEATIGGTGINIKAYYEGHTYTFVPTDDTYLAFSIYTGTTPPGTLYKVEGLDNVIFSMSSLVNGSLIWDSIVSAMPFILVCTVFGLGTVFIHRLIKSGSKGKAKLF